MKITKYIILAISALASITATSCKDKESYADLLRDENQAVNAFLVNYPVITAVPADSVFITTQDIE